VQNTGSFRASGVSKISGRSVSDWIKRKQNYKPAIAIPKTVEKLLEEKITFDFNFLFALDPVNKYTNISEYAASKCTCILQNNSSQNSQCDAEIVLQ